MKELKRELKSSNDREAGLEVKVNLLEKGLEDSGVFFFFPGIRMIENSVVNLKNNKITYVLQYSSHWHF